MPEIRWDMLGNYADVGGAIAKGFQTGQAMRQERETKNALAQYVQNPDDPRALNALAAADPALGMQARNQQIAMQDRQLQMQDRRRKSEQEGLEQHRERLTFGANLIEQVKPTDTASWQSVLGAMKQAGYDISDIPTEYDPAYADGVLKIGRSLNPPKETQTPSFLREADALGIPRAEAKEIWKARQGTVVINGIPHRLELPNGAPPVLTDADILEMDGGAGSSDSPSTFR